MVLVVLFVFAVGLVWWSLLSPQEHEQVVTTIRYAIIGLVFLLLFAVVTWFLLKTWWENR